MMKKLIAVLLVVFACFSLSANDIPMDWYVQIAKALNDLETESLEEWDIEKIDEKTIKVSRDRVSFALNIDTMKTTEKTKRLKEYYFRFNLSIEEEKTDRVLFMEKAGEFFSSKVGDPLAEGGVETISNGGYKVIVSYLVDFIDSDTSLTINSTFLDFCYELEGFTSLSHFFFYENTSETTYYEQ